MTTSKEMRRGVLDIHPLPTPRPKIAVRGKFATAYYPKPYKEYYDNLVSLIEALNLTPLTGLVSLSIGFSIPKAKTSKLLTPKGDIDNYVKGVMDSLEKAGVIDNDKMVVSLHAIKEFGEPQITFRLDEI